MKTFKRVRAGVRDFRVPGTSLHVMTAKALAERIKNAKAEAAEAERKRTNRQMSYLVHQNVMLGSENVVMKNKLKNVR